MNIECKHKNKCKSFETGRCAQCIHNTLEDFYEELEDNEDAEEEDEWEDEEEGEREGLAKKIANHPDFKNHTEKNDLIFVKKFFKEISEEWDDDAIEDIVYTARNILNGTDDSKDEWEDITEEDKENYGRKIAEHPNFPKFIRSHTTRKMFIRKNFPEIYEEVDEWALNDISNMSKFLYETEIKTDDKEGK